jgi:hypothetical protein
MIKWRQVMSAIQDDDARSLMTSMYKKDGHRVDDFDCKKRARMSACDAIIAAEDLIEMKVDCKSRKIERMAIRKVRRLLECELWS